MTFHEYPKARYLKGAYMAVNDAEHEAEMAALGWTDWHSDQAGATASIDAPLVELFKNMVGVAPSFEPVYIGSTADTPTEPAPERKKPGRPPKAK